MKRLCLERGCPESATHRGRCSTHSRQRERTINRVGKQVYNSKRWRILRRKKLLDNPVCERCDKVLATEVHHKHGVEVDAWSGLEALCKSCHSAETRREQERTGGRVEVESG